MAEENAVRGTKLLIEVETDTPGTYEHPCVINTDRSINFQADTTDQPTFDCDAPEAISWKQREKTELSADISGAGRLYTADLSLYDAWVRSPDAKNVRVTIDEDAEHGGGHWIGAYHLTQFQVSAGGRGTTVEVSITMQSTGEVGEFVPAA